MKYNEFFKTCIDRKNNFLCVGIDPDPAKMDPQFPKNPQGVAQFVREIIKATSDITPAYKFNLAFFEIWGWEGWKILEEIIAEIPKDILLIGDAKRGDIGNSSRFYAKAILEKLGFHSITLAPYMGEDSLRPFIEDETKGAFILCVTSNPSGRDLQEHGNPPLYQKTAELANNLNTLNNVGLVMGATKPEQLYDIRKDYPDLPFLIPGVGKQGGGVETAVEVCRQCGTGVINSSRSIIFAPDGTFPNNIRLAAEKYANSFKKI